METLLKQITVEKFKPSNFTVFNMIDDTGFVDELKGMFGKDYSIEDFEYMVFDLSIREKNAILYRMSSVLNRFKDLRKLIEKDLQDDPNKPKVRLYIDKDKSIAIIVKLADFDLVERVNKIKIDNKPEDLLPI